jgi:hypothetical protein
MSAENEIDLLAKSSSMEPHCVTFTFLAGRLSVHCNCEAGIYGKLCKHKVRLLSGDESMLFAKDMKADLAMIQEWVKQTDFPEMVKAFREAETSVEEAQRALKKQRAALEAAMAKGLGK